MITALENGKVPLTTDLGNRGCPINQTLVETKGCMTAALVQKGILLAYHSIDQIIDPQSFNQFYVRRTHVKVVDQAHT